MKKVAIGIIAVSSILLAGCTQTKQPTTQQEQPAATTSGSLESTKSGETMKKETTKTDPPIASFKPTTDQDIKSIDSAFDAVNTTDLNDKDLQSL